MTIKSKGLYVQSFIDSKFNFIESSPCWMSTIDKLNIKVADFLLYAEKQFKISDMDSLINFIYETVENYMFENHRIQRWDNKKHNNQIGIEYMAWVWVLTNLLMDFFEYLKSIIKKELKNIKEEKLLGANIMKAKWDTLNIKKKPLNLAERLMSWLKYCEKNNINTENEEDMNDAYNKWEKTI